VDERVRTVLVTGCSSGFGRAMVTAFLRAGWTVVATARHASARPHLLADALAPHAGHVSWLDLDVTRESDHASVAGFVRERHGQLDCLVNNAGHAVFGALEDLAPYQLREQIDVNYLGPALLTRHLLPLLRQARGRLIWVSSMFGETGFALSASYCAGKFALEGLAESLRLELAPHGVQVALVAPGRHRTGFAQNATWGETTFFRSSPYLGQSLGYAALKATLTARTAPGPEALARVVVRLAGRRHMPLRVRVGGDARTVHLLRRMLPERLWLAVWSAICGRALRAPAAPNALEGLREA